MEILAEKYFETMREHVEPFLAAHREEGNVQAADGLLLHYERYLNPNAVAGVVISHGFTESAEKFREVSFRMYVKGYSVFAIDHRGHANSGREAEPEYLTHVNKFDTYVDDFSRFIDEAVLPVSKGLPLILFGHSMGGAIAARFLMERPEVFSRAILNSPMIAPATAGMPKWMGKFISKMGCVAGMAKKIVPMYKPEFNPNEEFETSCDTCRERFDYYKQKRIENKHLRNSAPTFAWVKEAIGVSDVLLNPENAAKITCPVLLFQSEMENMVMTSAQDAFIALLKQGRLVHMKNAKHETYMSTDDVLKDYYNILFSFMKGE